VTILGIMQGRLTPPAPGRFQCFPRDGWRQEFQTAAGLDLDCIEWIFDAYGEDANPLNSEAGRAELADLIEKTGVQVRSICADWFMDYPLVRCDEAAFAERMDKLAWLIGVAGDLGIGRIVLPFVDASSMRDASERDAVAAALETVLPKAAERRVELHLETDLAPEPFAAFLSGLSTQWIWVNYDSGNSASLGYHPDDEFVAYGERIGSIHIKDRALGAATVPLGTGDCDFDALFANVRRVGYAGDFILQAARGEDGDEAAWIEQTIAFVKPRLGTA